MPAALAVVVLLPDHRLVALQRQYARTAVDRIAEALAVEILSPQAPGAASQEALSELESTQYAWITGAQPEL